MKSRILLATAMILISTGCNSPSEPSSGPTPEGPCLAWFNALGYSVDLYFPASDSLLQTAYITGDIPNDILSNGESMVTVLCSGSSSLQVCDVRNAGSFEFTIQLPPGSNPYAMAWDGQYLWVTLLMTAQVARVELEDGGDVDLFDVKANPTSIAATGQTVLVGHGSSWPDTSVKGGISVLNNSGAVIDSIATPDNVLFLRYFQSTGMVHAAATTYTGDGTVSIVDPATGAITAQVSTGGTPTYSISWNGGFIAGDGWNSGTVYFYDENGTLTDKWNTGLMSTTGVAQYGDSLYITDFISDMVCIADPSSMTLLDTLTAGTSGPQGIIPVQ